VPHLATGAYGDGYQMLAPAAFRVTWRFGDGARLGLVANLGAEPVTVTYAIAGVRIYDAGGVPARAEDTALAAWSAAWFLES
jgi:hypothetical protein